MLLIVNHSSYLTIRLDELFIIVTKNTLGKQVKSLPKHVKHKLIILSIMYLNILNPIYAFKLSISNNISTKMITE